MRTDLSIFPLFLHYVDYETFLVVLFATDWKIPSEFIFNFDKRILLFLTYCVKNTYVAFITIIFYSISYSIISNTSG